MNPIVSLQLNRMQAHLHRIERLIITQGEAIMATEDDNKALADQILAGVTTLVGTVNSEAAKIADLQTQLAAANGDQAKVDAVNAELTTIVSNINAATAAAPAAQPAPAADPNAAPAQ